MSSVVVDRDDSGTIELYYEDRGTGRPIVLIHGWPLSGASWERQVAALLSAGYRVVVYDRRGFGRSSKPPGGYDFDTLADDLSQLLSHLDLRDVTLVGHAMGTGELARYLGAYGAKRVRSAVFLASLPPFLLQTSDNPAGLDRGVFDTIAQRLAADRPGYLADFLADCFGLDHVGDRVTPEVVQRAFSTAMRASLQGTRDCVTAWTTDFRSDCRRVDVPALLVHGAADRILPLAATALPLHERLRTSRLVVIDGAPHGFIWTHGEQVNRELLAFLAERP